MEIIIKHHLIPNGIIRTVEPKQRPSLIEWLKEIYSNNPHKQPTKLLELCH